MILSCSACSTRYLVDPTVLSPVGRMVRCAKCGHQWMQDPPDDLPKQVDPVGIDRGERYIPGVNLPGFPRSPSRRNSLAGWAALVLIVVAVTGSGIVARDEITVAWPPAARLYDAIGFPVEALGAGLELRNVSSERKFEGGIPVLVIKGEIANVSKRMRDVPHMRGTLRSAEQRVVQQWTFSATQSRLLPGETAQFVTQVKNPPPKAAGLTLTFTRDS